MSILKKFTLAVVMTLPLLSLASKDKTGDEISVRVEASQVINQDLTGSSISFKLPMLS